MLVRKNFTPAQNWVGNVGTKFILIYSISAKLSRIIINGFKPVLRFYGLNSFSLLPWTKLEFVQ